jgi:hypothetical protein
MNMSVPHHLHSRITHLFVFTKHCEHVYKESQLSGIPLSFDLLCLPAISLASLPASLPKETPATLSKSMSQLLYPLLSVIISWMNIWLWAYGLGPYSPNNPTNILAMLFWFIVIWTWFEIANHDRKNGVIKVSKQ